MADSLSSNPGLHPQRPESNTSRAKLSQTAGVAATTEFSELRILSFFAPSDRRNLALPEWLGGVEEIHAVQDHPSVLLDGKSGRTIVHAEDDRLAA
jgi:hypothetical protein